MFVPYMKELQNTHVAPAPKKEVSKFNHSTAQQ